MKAATVKKSEIEIGDRYQEIIPSSHTTKKMIITISNVISHYETTNKLSKHGWQRRNKTYVYGIIDSGQYYPAKNSGFLDGLCHCISLNEFKKNFIKIN